MLLARVGAVFSWCHVLLRILQDVQDTLTHCMDFGRMKMVPPRTQAPAVEDSLPTAKAATAWVFAFLHVVSLTVVAWNLRENRSWELPDTPVRRKTLQTLCRKDSETLQGR